MGKHINGYGSFKNYKENAECEFFVDVFYNITIHKKEKYFTIRFIYYAKCRNEDDSSRDLLLHESDIIYEFDSDINSKIISITNNRINDDLAEINKNYKFALKSLKPTLDTIGFLRYKLT